MKRNISLFWQLKIVIADLKAYRLQSLLDTGILLLLFFLVLVLWSLKNGIISGFATDILNTPESLRIFVKSNGPISAKQIDYLKDREEVGFVAPAMDFFNQRMKVSKSKAPNKTMMSEIVSSGDLDPYIVPHNTKISKDTAAIGRDLATALDLNIADNITLHFHIKGKTPVDLSFDIAAIIDSPGWVERGLFVHERIASALSILSYAEPDRIKFDSSVADFGIRDSDDYVEIRLYASSLQNVAPLVILLNQMGWRAESRETLIKQRFALENSAGLIFLIVQLSCFGAATLTLVLSNFNRFARLRQGFSNLECHGMGRGSIVRIFTLQSFSITATALVVAVIFSIIAMYYLNLLLPQWFRELSLSGPSAQLSFWQVAQMSCGVIILDLMVSVMISFRENYSDIHIAGE